MRLDDLANDPVRWLEANDVLWRRARELHERHPAIDVTDLYHSLVQLERSPSERLARGLRAGRGLREAHERWARDRSARG